MEALLLRQLMTVEEHHAPGFYYIVRWRRLLSDADIDAALLESTFDDHDGEDSSNEYEERTIDAATDSLTLISQPVYKAYKIIVLAANEIGEAVSRPVPVIGFSSEAGTCLPCLGSVRIEDNDQQTVLLDTRTTLRCESDTCRYIHSRR
jgi:hypothetical protein